MSHVSAGDEDEDFARAPDDTIMPNVSYPVGPGSAATALTVAHRVRHAPGLTWLWSVTCEVKINAGTAQIGATDLAAAVTQEIDLNVAFPNNTFPTNVQRGEAYIKREVDFSGGTITAINASVGDANDPNGLVTATNIFTGAGEGYFGSPAAAEYAMQPESAFVPTLTLDTTGDNVADVTAGRLVVVIPFRPLHN